MSVSFDVSVFVWAKRAKSNFSRSISGLAARQKCVKFGQKKINSTICLCGLFLNRPFQTTQPTRSSKRRRSSPPTATITTSGSCFFFSSLCAFSGDRERGGEGLGRCAIIAACYQQSSLQVKFSALEQAEHKFISWFCRWRTDYYYYWCWIRRHSERDRNSAVGAISMSLNMDGRRVKKRKKERETGKKRMKETNKSKQIILQVHRKKHLQSEDFVFRSFFASELVTSPFIHSSARSHGLIGGSDPPRYPSYFADWLQVSRCSLSSIYPLGGFCCLYYLFSLCLLAAFPSHCDTTRLPC